MKITQPIRDIAELKKIKRYYREVKPNKRNSLLVVCGLNTALRISDILKLRWKDVYNENLLSFKSHIDVKEQKTGKKTTVFINKNLKEKFGALYNAFQFGAPPHAGMAPGVDRMIMLLRNEENIREIIPFPMNGNAQDLMCGAPNEVSEQQLREVHIKVRQ